VAYLLACVHWLPVSGGPFGDHYLSCDAVAAESGSNGTEGRMRMVERSPRRFFNAWQNCRFDA
jgi:hypothetical protein